MGERDDGTIKIDRRAFLATASSAVLVGCVQNDLIYNIAARIGVVDSVVVDAHCHIFNADDLAIKGFAERVVLADMGRLGRWAAKVVDKVLQRRAPGFDREERLLDDLIAGNGFVEIPPIPSGDELLNEVLDDLRESEPQLYQEMYEEVIGAPRPEGFVDPAFEDAQFVDSVVSRVVSWARLISGYRVQLAEKLIETYPEVDLFTPAMVDMDAWLEDRAAVRMSDQIRLNSKIAIWSGGRIQPFVGYDPLREVRSGGDPLAGSLRWAKEAVEEYGAIGVKVYPPMGFRATGNADKADATDEDRALDDALAEFFGWCVEADVPVQAHCNRSNGASDGAEENAHPKYWRRVLERFPALRLNLGHFGGMDPIADDVQQSWAREIAGLMEDFEHVYADFGFHEVALDASDERIEKFLDGLEWLVDAYPALRERALYGSDWQMILIKENHESYLDQYSEIYSGRFGSSATARFRGENALRFLGLDGAESGNRTRLVTFYRRHEMALPRWWRS